MRIKWKILILFFFGVLLPMISLIVFFATQINNQLSKREQSLIESELTRIQLNITTMVNTASNLANTFFSDKELAWALETYSESDKTSLTRIRRIDDQVLSHQAIQPFIEEINIYFDNENLFETTYAHLLSDKIQQAKWHKAFTASQKNTYLGFGESEGKTVIYLIRKLNLLKYESNNIVKIDLSYDSFWDNFSSDILTKENCRIFLINPDNLIAASNSTNTPKLYEDAELENESRKYVKEFDENSPLNGWKIIIAPQRNVLYSDLNNYIFHLVLNSFVVLLISMGLFYRLAHSIIKRLEYMARVMEQSENDELTEITIPMGYDEIGITSNCYNSMIKRIRSLMEENSRAYDELQSTNEELIATLEDVKHKEHQIDELIYNDKLTGLSNQFAITRYIDDQIFAMKDHGKFAVCFLDIDNFKFINDTYGHDIGDKVIQEIGTRLKTFESPTVHIGRFGGDEFIIIVKDYQNTLALNATLHKIRLAIREPIKINGISFWLTLSMGVSIFPTHSESRHELVKLADIALYKAKELGRDQIILYEDSLNQALFDKLKQQADIREAIKQNAFVLYYQPYYDISNMEVKGCEALLRWKPDYNFNMSPQEVIQHIEEMGLMVEFGFWIIDEACKFAKRLNDKRSTPLTVSINISAIQLMQNDFIERVHEILTRNKVNLDYISFEMTESILMNSIEKGSSTINRLRNIGILISLDDFGTGYSSLKYFKELPIATLKIDKSFVDNIVTNEYDEQLVDTMIQLAHNKKISVIAEGVETQEQLDRLSRMGCDMVQGYLLCKPIKEAEVLRISGQTEE